MTIHDQSIVTQDGGAEPPLEVVGGKAASLFALAARGFRVPPFFVITANAYRCSSSGHVSVELRRQLLQSWQEMGGALNSYAVRSSGLAEDSADFSYAGVFETVLDVRSEDALIDAVERCWASHRSVIADAYRSSRGVREDAAMAVVVQRMVRADWAGVSFSADPISQSLSVAVINATPGLGEKLVSGLVNPEEIRIDVESGRILDHRLPDGCRPLPEGLREEVLRATRRAGDVFGFPQDVEWAAQDDILYLLQSRPITTVAAVVHNRAMEPWAGQGTPDAPERVWTRAYADEVWAPPVTPIFYDIQNLTLVTGQQIANAGDRDPLPPDVFKYFRAAAYMDSAVLERLYATLPPLARRPPLLQLIAPERRDALVRAPWNWIGTLSRLWQFEVRNGRTFGLTRNYRFLAAAWPEFLARARHLCDTDVSTLNDSGLDDFLNQVWQLAGSVAPECEVAVLYYAHDLKLLLSGLLERWCGGGEQLYGDVSAGFDNSETVREADAIWALAQEIRAAGEEVADTARRSDWAHFKVAATALGLAVIVDHFEQFRHRHRHRGANYKDIIHPRWGDDPQLLWGHVRAFVAGDALRPGEANARSAVRRRDAQRAALAATGGRGAPIKRAVLRALFRGNEIYAGLRDNHRFYYDHVWWLVRRVYQEKGRRLHSAGLLADPTDVFFLVRGEIDALQTGRLATSTAATRISVRRGEWDTTCKVVPPKFLRRGYVPDDGMAAAPGDANALCGLAASSGMATGCARIVFDVAELARVASGDILVTRQTDPGWTPAFARLAGLVLETGGVLAHGASLCREYGLPCVTAVEAATLRIGDGDLIAVNGGDGTVTILRRAIAL